MCSNNKYHKVNSTTDWAIWTLLPNIISVKRPFGLPDSTASQTKVQPTPKFSSIPSHYSISINYVCIDCISEYFTANNNLMIREMNSSTDPPWSTRVLEFPIDDCGQKMVCCLQPKSLWFPAIYTFRLFPIVMMKFFNGGCNPQFWGQRGAPGRPLLVPLISRTRVPNSSPLKAHILGYFGSSFSFSPIDPTDWDEMPITTPEATSLLSGKNPSLVFAARRSDSF